MCLHVFGVRHLDAPSIAQYVHMKFMRISFITMYDLLLIFFLLLLFWSFSTFFVKSMDFIYSIFFLLLNNWLQQKHSKLLHITSFTSKLWNSSKIVDKMQSNIFFFSFFIYQFYSESPTLWDRSIYIIYWSN